MITDAANQLADEIIKQANQHSEMAKYYAVKYAQTDKPEDKANYNKETMLEGKLKQLHRLVCQGLHATEAEMKKRLAKQEGGAQ